MSRESPAAARPPGAMLFNTLEFAGFLIVVLALDFALPHRPQNRMRLVASYVFYGAWD